MSHEFIGQSLVPGPGSGPALVLAEPLSLWGGLDPETGEIIDRRHPNSGQNVCGQVLMMSGSRGSSSASSILLESIRAGTAPAAIILQERDGILSLGAAVAQAMYGSSLPVVVLAKKEYTQINSGDHVEVSCQGDIARCIIHKEKTMIKTTMYDQPDLKILPSEEELGQLDRKLVFQPASLENLNVLTPEQIEFYNKEGYLKPLQIFDDGEAAAIRTYFDKVLAAVLAAGGDSYSIISAHMKYGPVYDLVKHPKILGYVNDILGDDVICWGAHFFCKMPHDPKKVAWHQDASFWPLTPSKTTTVWLAIDDADTENACMRFVAGSHHHGHLTYRMAEDAEQSVLRQSVDNVEQFGTPVDDVLKAGQISLHNDLLLHGSDANHSSRRRCGLTLRYCAADVWSDPTLGWNKEGVVVSGTDPSGHWANPPRPDVD